MRVTILTLDFPPQTGGVQAYLGEIVLRLASRCEVSVITPVQAAKRDEPFRREVTRATIPAFLRALCQFEPDRVLVGHAHPRLLLPAALVSWRHYGVLAHGNDFLAAQRRWHRPLFNWLLRNATPLITNSKSNARRLRELGMPNPVVITPATDPSRFTPAPLPPPPPWTLLSVGRLVPRKGIDTVLQALPELLEKFPDLRYHIVGDGPDRRRLQRLTRELGVEHHVRFLGRVADEVLPGVYRQAHIFVLPVREEPESASVEGFGIVFLEASASGLPIVAGRSGGAADAVRDGETGVLVPPGDPRAVAEAISRFLQYPELCRLMGQAGRRWVKEEMNWKRVMERMLAALLEGK